MATRRTPRQIAAEVIQSLAELTSEMIFDPWHADGGRALQQHCHKARAAILAGEPMPPSPDIPALYPEWPTIEAAMQYAADVFAAADAGDVTAAWRAAAEASFWHGAAQGLLRPAALRRLAKLDGRKRGTDKTKHQKEQRRLRARELYEKGKPWTKDEAAEKLHEAFGVSRKTLRGYLVGA